MGFAELYSSKEQEYGLPAGFLDRTAGIESNHDPNAKNPNSSAGGLFQFIDSTARQYGLQNRYDPIQATDAAARLARDNAKVLRDGLGRDPTAGELYLAHQQGAGGALKLLRNADAPAESVVGAAAARLNAGGGLTAGQLAQKWTGKFDGVTGSINPALAYAASRGRNPQADMPAPGAEPAMGQASAPAVDWSQVDPNSPDGGVGAFQRIAAGGLGGLGGFRIPQGGPSATVQPAAQPGAVASPAAVAPSPAGNIESLIPKAATDPFALFGPGLARNQAAEAERSGKVEAAKWLVSEYKVPPQQAVAMLNNEAFLKMVMQKKAQEISAAAGEKAAGILIGGGGGVAPAPSTATAGGTAPASGAPYNPMTDKSLEGINQTDRAKLVAPLRVLMTPNVPKEIKDVAEAQYKAALEESKATPTTKEYLIAKAQGFTGTMLDYKKELAAAGRSVVTVDNRAEGAEAKGRGEGLAKRWNDIAEEGSKAGEDALLFQRFGDILSTVKTGKGTETLEKIRQATGISLDPNTDNVQALNAMINYLAPRLRVPGSGAQSDRELGNFLSSIPSLAGTPDGNKKILETLSGFIRYKQQRAAIASEWQNGDISAKEADNRLKALPSPFPPAPSNGESQTQAAPAASPAPGAGATQPAPATPPKIFTKAEYDKLAPGTEYQDAEGNVRRKRGE